MVYQKDNGSFGFSWQKQLIFLQQKHPDDIPEILYTKLEIIGDKHLLNQWNCIWCKTNNFEDSAKLAKQFIEKHDINNRYAATNTQTNNTAEK